MTETRTAILMMQETHLTQGRVEEIQGMYADKLKIYYSQHEEAPTQKEGVAVVLNKRFVSTAGAEAVVIVKGRAIQLTVAWRGGDKRSMLCIYAPTSEGVAERAAFYREVAAYYEQNPGVPRPDLMAGDFNNVEDAVDRVPVPGAVREDSVTALDELKMKLGMTMTDGWRVTYPTERNFTFQRGVGEARTMARLDRIYVKTSQMKWTREWTIEQPGLRTDHRMATVTLTTPTAPEVGKGRPVFPLHLLRDKALAKRMKNRGKEAVRELTVITGIGRTEEQNPQTVLRDLKQDWLEMARQREREITPKLMKEICELEKRHA
ncbi:hypothetical protein C2E23DRAFT_742512, partial [Lenzites betulinus]